MGVIMEKQWTTNKYFRFVREIYFHSFINFGYKWDKNLRILQLLVGF